jgi:hypothetical protein
MINTLTCESAKDKSDTLGSRRPLSENRHINTLRDYNCK